MIQRHFIELSATGVTINGQPVTVHLPSGTSRMHIMKYDNSPVIERTADIKDGDNVVFVDEYHSMKLE